MTDLNETDAENVSHTSPIEQPKERPEIFWTITLAWLALMAIGFVFSISTWSNNLVLFDLKAQLGQTVLATQILWIALSIRVINIDQLGGISSYGLPMIQVRRGPKLVIFGIFQLKRFSGKVFQDQYPADSDLIQKTSDDVPLGYVERTDEYGNVTRHCMVRPFRIVTSGPKDGDEDDILNAQMVLGTTFWVRAIIDQPFWFLVNVGGDLEQVQQQMRDTGESFLTAEFSIRTPSEIIKDFTTIQDALQKEIKEDVKKWGIKVIDVGITPLNLTRELSTELRNIPVKKAEAVQARVKADADRYVTEQAGKAEGKAAEDVLAGQGRGYKRAGASVGVEPEVILQAEVARDTIGEGDVIIGTDGIAQAIGAGKAIFGNKDKPVESTET